MNHWEMENVVTLGVALKSAGFDVSQICCSRQSCFDLVAKKGERAALVKAHSEVGRLSIQDWRELKVIAERVSAASLVVSQRTHDHLLEDDTVYMRYSVFVVTAKTLRNVAVETAFPLIYAGPGGYSVEVDGELVEKRRKELGLSVGQLAEMVGVSRRTLYGYERGMTKASVGSAYNLAKALGVPIAKPIDVLQPTEKQRQCLLRKSKKALEEQRMLRRVFRNFTCCDFTQVHRAPFDFIVNVPNERLVILGAVAADVNERFLDERVEEILSICRVIGAYPVLVTERAKPLAKDILCVSSEELAKMHSPEELIASV
ncbi:MAG: helix-turn-helix domain-containing protein [Candidatus Bathyarchaeota archaeon]|nr:helix-turn-helix domain-containing protein [Candidatus Bathyarchaeota archaeon]